ncbi:sugar phosphate isomerase/epimerase family protein [Humidisolicoccus flavus]|uniref:sugar phosphate isomerase/epimerase family protein n=1 Tax=Humidisolicoccus flavus TaxID=3111414 RepID=UPI00325393E4
MIRVGMSTSCAYPLKTEDGFRLASEVGFDGIEIMVTNEKLSRDPEALLALSEKYNMPILSIHAPVLLLTMFVWGRDPYVKLDRAAELAKQVGAGTVVVHPPFRWQGSYAREFERLVREISQKREIEIAVENMFPWRVRGRDGKAYLPGIDPSEMDVDAATLDFSHCALSGRDSLELAKDLGDRLRHIHLTDGVGAEGGNTMFDEHLPPGHGNEPVAEVLEMLAANNFTGDVVAEVSTRPAKNDRDRIRLLQETLDFAREHLGQAAPGSHSHS